MKKFLSLSVALVALLAFSSSAAHATNFTFTVSGSAFNGSGTFTTTGTGPYTIISASGLINGHSISLLPASSYPLNGTPNDNLLMYTPGSSSPYLDGDGFSVLLAGTNQDVNFYFYFYNYVYVAVYGVNGDFSNSSNLSAFTVSPAIASAPEPASFVLLGTGILGLAGTIKRRLRA